MAESLPALKEIVVSPLSEAQSKSLDELFARMQEDPMTITDPELDLIVDGLQHLRLLFEAEEAAAQKTGKPVRSSVAKIADKSVIKSMDISGDL
jgi:hypothetical protein